jgi:hypothetical protein
MNIAQTKRLTLTDEEVLSLAVLSSKCPIKRHQTEERLKVFSIDVRHLTEKIERLHVLGFSLLSKQAKTEFKNKQRLLQANADIALRYAGNKFDSLGAAMKAAGLSDNRRLIKVKLNNPAQSIIDELGVVRAM